ncbi:MAG: hypothetical protein ACXVCM_07095 [Ktedonobacteraceae bacterium]
MGAPRRLFTSHQGRTGAVADPPPDEEVEARRQAGQSIGVRGLSRRCTVVRLAPPFEEEGAIREPVKTPEPRQTEEETDYEQEHDDVKGHNDPRCLKWGEGRTPYL